MNKQIKQPSMVQTKQHNRKRKGMGLVAGIMLAGMLLTNLSPLAVLAEETTNPVTTEVVTETTDETTETEATIEAAVSETTASEDFVTETTEVTAETETIAVTTEEENTPTNSASVNLSDLSNVVATAENTAASNVSSRITAVATIENNSTTAQNQIISGVRVQSTVNGQIKGGDYVDYVLENVSAFTLNGKDVVTGDGTVIGKLSVISSSTAFDEQMAGKANLSPRATQMVLRVTFNDAVNSLNGLTYSFLAFETQTVTIVGRDSQINQAVKVAGKTVGQNSFINKAYESANPSRTKMEVLSDRDVLSENDELTPKFLSLGLLTTAEQPLSKGDRLRVTFKPTSTISYNEAALKSLVGKTIKFSKTRGYFDGMQVNANGVVVYDDNTGVEMRVESVSDKVMVLEALGTLAKDAAYTTMLANGFELDKVSLETIDTDANLVKGIDYTFELIKGGQVVSTIDTEDATLKIYGSAVTAAAFRKRGTVRIEYQDVDTKQTLTTSDFVVKNALVDSSYDSATKHQDKIVWASGRTWLKTGTFQGEVVGTVKEGTTTVIQYFKELKGSVVEKNVSTEGEELTAPIDLHVNKPLGTAYDTTAQDEIIVLEDGRTFKLLSSTDNVKGKVVEGLTTVINTYEEVKGSVFVHYKDTAGNTISPDVVDTDKVSTATEYDTTDHKPTVIEKDGKKYQLVADKTDGQEKGLVAAEDTHVTYVYELLVPPVAPASPVPAKLLPHTGEATSYLVAFGALGLLGLVATFAYKKKQEN